MNSGAATAATPPGAASTMIESIPQHLDNGFSRIDVNWLLDFANLKIGVVI
jgi:hypothetical protein